MKNIILLILLAISITSCNAYYPISYSSPQVSNLPLGIKNGSYTILKPNVSFSIFDKSTKLATKIIGNKFEGCLSVNPRFSAISLIENFDRLTPQQVASFRVIDPELDYVISLSCKFTGPNGNDNFYGLQPNKSKDVATADLKVYDLNTAQLIFQKTLQGSTYRTEQQLREDGNDGFFSATKSGDELAVSVFRKLLKTVVKDAVGSCK